MLADILEMHLRRLLGNERLLGNLDMDFSEGNSFTLSKQTAEQQESKRMKIENPELRYPRIF